jgi:hypothetical protein
MGLAVDGQRQVACSAGHGTGLRDRTCPPSTCCALQAARGSGDDDGSDITASQQEGRVWLLGEQRWEVVNPKRGGKDQAEGA